MGYRVSTALRAQHQYPLKMRTIVLCLLVTATALYAHAADVIPPELVGEWRDSPKGARFFTSLYLSSDGRGGVLFSGMDAFGSKITARYNRGTHVLKLNLLSAKQWGGPESIQLTYDPVNKTVSFRDSTPGAKPLTRKNSGVPDWLAPYEAL
jgi:hypothetical protein